MVLEVLIECLQQEDCVTNYVTFFLLMHHNFTLSNKLSKCILCATLFSSIYQPCNSVHQCEKDFFLWVTNYSSVLIFAEK